MNYSLRKHINNLTLFCLSTILLTPSLSNAGDQHCTSEATTANNIELLVTKENGCVVLACENVLSKNIESALILCHQTEKDYLFCGWRNNKRITDVRLKLIKERHYSVTLKKCAQIKNSKD